MRKKNLVIVLILISLSIYGVVKLTTAPGKYDDFAKCLTNTDIVMYGTDWCSHCKEQKALFGRSFKYVDYRNCDYNKEECDNKDITGYPTWLINEKKISGYSFIRKIIYIK